MGLEYFYEFLNFIFLIVIQYLLLKLHLLGSVSDQALLPSSGSQCTVVPVQVHQAKGLVGTEIWPLLCSLCAGQC